MKLISVRLSIFSVLLCQSCASMSGLRQEIVVDSSQKGLKVYNEDREFLGQTPFIYSPIRSSKFHYIPKNDVSAEEMRVSQSCNYRWFVSGVFNLPIVGHIVDFITGAAWHCNPDFFIQRKISVPKPSCPKIATIVSGIPDAEERENIRTQFQKSLSTENQNSSCFEFTSSSKIEDLL
jgi:hypothetical protein